MSTHPGTVRAIGVQSVTTVVRQHTVTAIAALFLILIMFSAYLGWSATHTVDSIYQAAAKFLTAQHQPVPPNPVLQSSSLGLLRNMATYVSLLGSLAALVIGHQLIAADRKAGILPLMGTRPLRTAEYAAGKLWALAAVLGALIVFSATISALTFVLLPAFSLGADEWLRLFAFFGTSYLYMLVFGLLGLGFAAKAKSESVGLLVPLVFWLTLTFILPQITSNVNPVAALNPVSALATPPDSGFFVLTGYLLEPFSLAEAYRLLSAQLLHFLPADFTMRDVVPPIVSLIIACGGLAGFAWFALARLNFAQGDYNG